MQTRITLRSGDGAFVADIDPAGRVAVDGSQFSLSTLPDGSVRLDGADGVRRGWTTASADTIWVFVDGRVFAFERERAGTRSKRGGSHHGSLSAPMPATVRRIDVKAGDVVRKGQTLMLLEAMKMELPVRAAGDGTVTSVNCREGELVQPGTTLVELDEAD